MTSRFGRFAVVGAVGFALQLVALGTLTTAADWGYVYATAMAVEIAALHNFWWHERWTWGDRRLSRRAVAGRLIRYHLTTAITSMTGNVMLTAAFVELAGAPVILANAAAVAAMAAANFVVADQWVFARRGIALTAAIALTPGLADAAELKPVTLSAWNDFVEQAERRLHSCSCDTTRPQGTSIEVPGGTIHQWRGSVLVKGVTVDDVLHALTVPGTPPPQDDVLESRVLSRSGDSMRIYLKLKRRAIVTVTYDTEHDVTFSRLSPHSAASRSIATRISELDGADRGSCGASIPIGATHSSRMASASTSNRCR